MIVNQSNLADLNRVYRVGFNETFSQFENQARQIATVIPMTTASIKLYGIKAFKKMREWVGPRQHKNLEAFSFTVEPRKYEDTVDVPRDTIEDDTYNQFMTDIRGMATAAAELEMELVAQILQGTHSQTGYDGKKLGANDHEMGEATYDNLVTTPISMDAIKAAIDWFGSLKDEAGNEINLSPTHLITRDKGAAKWAANKLLNSENIVDGGSLVDNETFKALEHLQLPHITSDTFWAVVCMNHVYRPVFLCRAPLLS